MCDRALGRSGGPGYPAGSRGHDLLVGDRGGDPVGAVVVGLRYRNGRPLYDKTLQTVLGERPCRVIVVSEQGAQRGGELVPSLT